MGGRLASMWFQAGFDVFHIDGELGATFPVGPADNIGGLTCTADDDSRFPEWSKFLVGCGAVVDSYPDFVARKETRKVAGPFVVLVSVVLSELLVVVMNDAAGRRLCLTKLGQVVGEGKVFDAGKVRGGHEIPKGCAWVIPKGGREWSNFSGGGDGRVVAEHERAEVKFPV